MEKPESAGSVVPSCGRTTDITAKLLNDYDANAMVGDGAERSVEASPTLGIDLLLQRDTDLLLAARPQLRVTRSAARPRRPLLM
jgi:hypothetical protein